MNDQRSQIIRTARGYLGVPFRHQGRSRNGLDCIGLIIRVGKDLMLTDVDFTAYERAPDARTFSDNLRKHLTKQVEAKAGDILVFALPSYPCHIGILTDIGTVIHALSKRERVVEHTLSKEWKRRIRSIWSFPESVEEIV